MWFFAFLSSLGALLFEFSLSQFLSMLIGNSAFGYTFVIGAFLLSMGIGSWLAEYWPKLHINPRASLEIIELIIPTLMTLSLPILVSTVFFVRQMSPLIDNCQSLVCSSVGLLVIVETLILLMLVGVLVGMEIPLFNALGNSRLGKILAGDYLGAFVAGIAFAPVLLPRLGLIGILVLASALHLAVAFFVRGNSYKIKIIWLLLVLINILTAINYEKIEGKLFQLLVQPSRAQKSEIIHYSYTGKQSLLFTKDTYVNGEVDKRLFLDGFLQWSTLGGIRNYHLGIANIRNQLGDGAKKILILGGGDGLAAEHILEKFPEDIIQIVDFDCKLLELFAEVEEFRLLAPGIRNAKNIKITCADAFWFVTQPNQKEKWDLVLVDFPHGIGDAASSKVETLGFYYSIWNILQAGGYVSTHHEDFGSKSQICVKNNLTLAGFLTQDEKLQGMGFIQGKKIPQELASFVYNAKTIQSELRLPCWEMFEDQTQ